VRRRAVERLGFLGVAIDSHRNDTAQEDADITNSAATAQTLVIPPEKTYKLPGSAAAARHLNLTTSHSSNESVPAKARTSAAHAGTLRSRLR
jgi:hypothetical protein